MTKKCICFAYYANDVFIGWYADTWGTVSANSPKIYGYSKEQLDKIRSSVIKKLQLINTSDYEKLKGNATTLADTLSLAQFSSQEILKNKKIRLKVVECPFYEGHNPNYNQEEFEKLIEQEYKLMCDEGVFETENNSPERIAAIKAFIKKYGKVKSNHWITPDYNEVRNWASQEPKDFLTIIEI